MNKQDPGIHLFFCPIDIATQRDVPTAREEGFAGELIDEAGGAGRWPAYADYGRETLNLNAPPLSDSVRGTIDHGVGFLSLALYMITKP